MAKQRSHTNTGIPGLSFSWKRALGVTSAKRNIARATGISTPNQEGSARLDACSG